VQPYYPNILLIAGSGRNIGKTTLADSIVKKYAAQYNIIGLKVTSVYIGEGQLHGKKHIHIEDGFVIREETDRSGIKDTSRLLLAGASRAFYVQAKDNELTGAMEAFFKMVSPQSLIVCESGSLREVLKPGLFLLVNGNQLPTNKQRIAKWKPLADCLISLKDNQLDFNMEALSLNHLGWHLKETGKA
jgi:hypothetical protein